MDLCRSLLLGATVLGRTKLSFPKSNLFLPDLDANPNSLNLGVGSSERIFEVSEL